MLKAKSLLKLVVINLTLLLLVSVFLVQIGLAAPNFADASFQKLWERTDKAVEAIPADQLKRGYLWGPASLYQGYEPYAESAGNKRLVQYFDKGRMELNNPAANQSDPGYVTSGLLVKELVLGRLQNGDNVNNFTQGNPSEVQIAGDPNTAGANSSAPTYKSFAVLATFNNDHPVNSKIGDQVNLKIDRQGNVSTVTSPDPSVHYGFYEQSTRHNVADVFYNYGLGNALVWNGSAYVNSPLFTPSYTYFFGLPITDPYWTKVVVAGVEKDVLVQLFERRVLTYTPSNSPANRVEMGNVGQHYYRWRYLENIGLSGSSQPYDYSQFRAPYLKSGPIPQGGNGNVTNFQVTDTGPNDYKIISSPVYDPDKKLLIIGTNTGEGLVAIDISNFNAPVRRWNFYPTSVFNGPIAMYKGVVYAGGYDSRVYALDEDTGAVKWATAAPNDSSAVHYVNYALAFDTNSIYFVREDRYLYGINLSDGSAKFTVKPGATDLVTSPVIGDDGTIYVGGGDQKVYAFDSSGQQLSASRWATSLLDSNIGAYSLAFGNGRLYAGSNFGTLYAFNSNGTIQQQKHFTDGKGVGTAPAIVNLNGVKRVYVGTDDGTVYGLNADNVSEVQWLFSATTRPIIKSSPAVVDGYVYFGADNKKVYRVAALDASNSVELTTANDIFDYNSPVVNSGYVIIASKDGILHLIK